MSCHVHLPAVDMHRVSAVSILSGEHRVILQTLDCLGAIAERALTDERIPRPHADQALEILRLFADRCHHGKEEEILFPALEAKVPGFGPTQVMRHEHVEGRAFIAGMSDALTRNAWEGFAMHAWDYIELLRAHIMKEDEVLFRMAQELLSPEEDADLLRAYRAVEHDDMGDGTHERLLGLADGLAAAYGVPRASADPVVMTLLTAVCGCHDEDNEPGLAPAPAWQQQAAELRFLAEKVARRHGGDHPDMAVLAEVVTSLAEADGDAATAAALTPRLRTLTRDFRPWEGACASVWQLFYGLDRVASALQPAGAEA